MDLRKCECGGTMTKRSKSYMITSNEIKHRLRCTTCNAWRSVYESNGKYSIEKRRTGRPMDNLEEA